MSQNPGTCHRHSKAHSNPDMHMAQSSRNASGALAPPNALFFAKWSKAVTEGIKNSVSLAGK